MSFQAWVQELRDVLLKDQETKKLFRENLITVGRGFKFDIRGCTDLDAVTLRFLPSQETESNTDNTFEKQDGTGTAYPKYQILMEVKFEVLENQENRVAGPKDRFLDERGQPGLLSVVRLMKNAFGRHFSMRLDKTEESVNFRYLSVSFPPGPPAIQMNMTIEIGEEVQMGYRKP